MTLLFGRSLLKFATVLSVGTALCASPSYAEVLYKIPKTFDANGTIYTNLEGFYLAIGDYRNFQIFSGDNRNLYLGCDSIKEQTQDGVNVWGGGAPRYECNTGTPFTCADLYGKAAYGNKLPRDSARLNELTPFKPVSHVARYWYNQDKTRNVTAININFFDTDVFPNRPTGWNTIFQEACGLNLGNYKGNATSAVMSNYNDVEVTNGSNDQNFGSIVFRTDGTIVPYDYTSNPGTYLANSNRTAVAGVWLRYNGTNRAKSNGSIPEFVRLNWDEKVARTAIGYNPTTYDMKVLVVQGGKGGAGITAPDIRNFFIQADYPYLMLLDGGGSSQLASTLPWSRVGTRDTSGGRANCLQQDSDFIVTCSLKGNTVNSALVSHWDSTYKSADPSNSSNVLVDRRVPQALIIRAK